MSEEQQRFGDGQDNYLQGAQKGMQAAKQAAAVGKTAEAGANAAAATVQGSVETGKAAANIAAGAAAGLGVRGIICADAGVRAVAVGCPCTKIMAERGEGHG